MRMSRCAVVLAVSLYMLLPAWPQQAGMVRYENPLLGFSLLVRDEWLFFNGGAGNLDISMAATVGGMAGDAHMWLYRMKRPPEQEASVLARELETLGGAKPQVGPTGRPGEWAVTMTSNGVRGPLVEQWLLRDEGGVRYGIAAMVRPQYVDALKADIDAATSSCHLIPTVATTLFREPTETAYRITMPKGWQWKGKILRTPMIPGHCIWRAVSPAGTTAALSNAPLFHNMQVPYESAQQAAQGEVLDMIHGEVPDARLVAVRPEAPIANAVLNALTRLGVSRQPKCDVATADYACTIAGVPCGIRFRIMTLMLEVYDIPDILKRTGVVPQGDLGNWVTYSQGGWAPVERFDQEYALARAVLASFRADPAWVRKQRAATSQVIAGRNEATSEAAQRFDDYIRQSGSGPRGRDKQGNEHDVPSGPGDAYIDQHGQTHRVPPGEQPDPNWEKLDEVG